MSHNKMTAKHHKEASLLNTSNDSDLHNFKKSLLLGEAITGSSYSCRLALELSLSILETLFNANPITRSPTYITLYCNISAPNPRKNARLPSSRRICQKQSNRPLYLNCTPSTPLPWSMLSVNTRVPCMYSLWRTVSKGNMTMSAARKLTNEANRPGYTFSCCVCLGVSTEESPCTWKLENIRTNIFL